MCYAGATWLYSLTACAQLSEAAPGSGGGGDAGPPAGAGQAEGAV